MSVYCSRVSDFMLKSFIEFELIKHSYNQYCKLIQAIDISMYLFDSLKNIPRSVNVANKIEECD